MAGAQIIPDRCRGVRDRAKRGPKETLTMVLQAVFARTQVVLGFFGVLVAIGSLAGCGDDAGSSTDSDAATPLDAATSEHDASTSHDAAVTDTGADDAAMSTDDAGEDNGDAGTETDAAVAGGDCNLVFSMDTSNVVDATMPLSSACMAAMFGGGADPTQLNFSTSDSVGTASRMFGIDWFDAARTAGTVIDVANGYDYATMSGAYASYMENDGADSRLWVADQGSVKIESVNGNDYVVKLIDLHFASDNSGPVAGTAMGDFVLNGTITATIP
jgi:hypothetical protein